MSTQVITVNQDADVFCTLKNSLYPGARDESINMVLSYCRAAKLDPLLKPVHIVPMSIKEGEKYIYRDIIMPGVGLYRIQAARTGEYAGISEPEFGQTITEKIGAVEVSYPEWCKITVKRLIKGEIAEFTSKEYWKENYAPKAKNDSTPNTMWLKRPFGQIAKCTEAQSVRKAFPEAVGANPTAEEMEGKTLESSHQGNSHPRPVLIENASINNNINFLRDLIEKTNTSKNTVDKWLNAANAERLDELSPVQITSCINALSEKLKDKN